MTQAAVVDGVGGRSSAALKRIAEASAWDIEARSVVARSERRAWLVAGAATLLAVLGLGFGLAIALRPAPAPVVLTLDRASGDTMVLPRLDAAAVPQVVALDHHNAASYVRSRESYNYSLLNRDYEQVARTSTPEVWAPYQRQFTGAEALQDKLGDKELRRVTIIGVRLTSGYAAGRSGEAIVTWEREVRGVQAPQPVVTRYVSTVRYEYRPAAMKRDVDRIENPFGFIVTAYRSDAEIAASSVKKDGEGS